MPLSKIEKYRKPAFNLSTGNACFAGYWQLRDLKSRYHDMNPRWQFGTGCNEMRRPRKRRPPKKSTALFNGILGIHNYLYKQRSTFTASGTNWGSSFSLQPPLRTDESENTLRVLSKAVDFFGGASFLGSWVFVFGVFVFVTTIRDRMPSQQR